MSPAANTIDQGWPVGCLSSALMPDPASVSGNRAIRRILAS
jgi:hypothetical protein